MAKAKGLLGELLVQKGHITEDQLNEALSLQKKSGELLGSILVKKKFISEEILVRFLSEVFEVEYVQLSSLSIPENIITSVPDSLARQFEIIPIEKKGDFLVLAMANPQNFFLIDELRATLHCQIKAKIATESSIRQALKKYYGQKSILKEIITSAVETSTHQVSSEKKVFELKDSMADAPAIRLVNQLLTDAVNENVSDIHIEPQENKLVIRFRIDGILRDIIQPPKHMHDFIISRVKIMSRLDIAEKRMPQDGKFPMKVNNNDVDVRVSIYPTIHGEKGVLRILNRSSVSFGLEDLGFDEENKNKFTSLIKRPHGIILVTGPTGSGKTTTLYTALETIKTSEKNLLTIEDPVEYQLNGISQSQIYSKIGLSFATLLRAIMRQDPDIILVGEIRDLETAEVSIRAALTGHLVLSTLHTNDAPGAVIRLTDMGVQPFLVSSSVIGVIAQRLVRKICPKCKVQTKISADEAKSIGIPPDAVIYHGKGCDACTNSGYKGRIAVFEIMTIDEDIRTLIVQRAPLNDIRTMAKEKGMKTLREDALKKVVAGTTTIEEVLRVSQDE
ncbi:MAG: type II secretion system ATPase GspE [Candidatus Omnitrophica bacterium]|nr:type II secretion system ATPase GspE [Candidatus Omnitrophota bacterium]